MSKISWTDKTWNPVHGCTKTSIGCKNCYAERMSKRLAGRHGYPEAPDNFKVTLRSDRLEQPLKWRKPSRVFVCSMSDLFHEDVPDEFIARIWSMMYQCEKHTFQVLTKRPARMLDFLSKVGYWEGWWTHNGTPPERAYNGTGIVLGAGKFSWPLRNVRLGVTVEDQATADKRIPLLFQTPAAMRWISAEPLLGRIDLQNYLGIYYEAETVTDFDGHSFYKRSGRGLQHHDGTKLDFVTTGGETGPGARPSDPDWFRSLRDQCQTAGIKFHFKQHGEWQGVDQSTDPVKPGTPEHTFDDGTICFKVGNKRAGHKLDGVEHQDMPEVTK